MRKEKTREELYKKTLETKGANKLWNYYLDLIKTPEFVNFAKKIRKNSEDGKKVNSLDIGSSLISTAIAYGLDGLIWEESFRDYIFNGKITRPEGIDLCKIMTVPELEEILNYANNEDEDFSPSYDVTEPLEALNIHMNYPIALLISPYASFHDIKDFLDKNYTLQIENIKKAIKEKEISIGKSKKKKPFIQERNDFIYQNQHLSGKEIMALIHKKFGKDAVIDYAYIGKIISMEKKRRKEV